MSFQDIETQSNVGLEFLIDAYKRCDMVVPEVALQRKSLAQPSSSRTPVTPPISVHNNSSSTSVAPITLSNSHNIPLKPTGITGVTDKRSSLPSSPDIQTPRSAKRKFGHDRWSHSLKLELSDDSDEDGKQRIKVVKTNDAKKELLAKKREIERMKQLLKEAELAKLATTSVDSSIVPQYNSPDSKDSKGVQDGLADNIYEDDNASPYEQIISTVNETLDAMLEEKRRLDVKISDLKSLLKSSDLKKLESDVDQLTRILESKRKLVVEATVHATKLEAQLDAANESSGRIAKSIQGYEQKLSDLKRKNEEFLRKSSSPMVAATGSDSLGPSHGRNSVPSISLESAAYNPSSNKAPERVKINIDGTAVVLKAYDSDSSLASSTAYHALLDPDTEKIARLAVDNQHGTNGRKSVVESFTEGHDITLAQPYPAENSDSSMNDKHDSLNAESHLDKSERSESEPPVSGLPEREPLESKSPNFQSAENGNSENQHNASNPGWSDINGTDPQAEDKPIPANDVKPVENSGGITTNSEVESLNSPVAKLV